MKEAVSPLFPSKELSSQKTGEGVELFYPKLLSSAETISGLISQLSNENAKYSLVLWGVFIGCVGVVIRQIHHW